MRKPSNRILNQSCQVIPATRGQDTSGGLQLAYDTSVSRILPCSAQPHEYEEVIENDRITPARHWRLMFANDPLVSVRDKVVWTDAAGQFHYGFVEVSRDEAGRGMAYSVRVVERL